MMVTHLKYADKIPEPPTTEELSESQSGQLRE